MASSCIGVIALCKFAVLSAHLSETDVSLQVEQAVFRLEMVWDCSLYPDPVLSLKEGWADQEGCGEGVPHVKVAFDEPFERSKHWFHK